MGDTELLSMLAAEAERRSPTIITGIEELATSGEKNSARIEELRVEAHGLKGAALVVGQ
jgi:chemotaxis protein histidine kinase CheA